MRTALFQSANQVVAYLPQQAADRIDAAYQPKPGWQRKGRAHLTVDGIFDPDSTTYVSSRGPIQEFGPLLRQNALRRGLALATLVVLLIDGAEGLANMGRLCFPTAIQSVDFYPAMEHARKVLQALLGSKDQPQYKRRLRR